MGLDTPVNPGGIVRFRDQRPRKLQRLQRLDFANDDQFATSSAFDAVLNHSFLLG